MIAVDFMWFSHNGLSGDVNNLFNNFVYVNERSIVYPSDTLILFVMAKMQTKLLTAIASHIVKLT